MEKADESKVDSKNNIEKKLKHAAETFQRMMNFGDAQLDRGAIDSLVDKVIVENNRQFDWLINVCESEDTSPFYTNKVAMNTKIELKAQNTIDIRESNYQLAFSMLINFDEARKYRKEHGSYLRPSQWEDIKVNVYIR